MPQVDLETLVTACAGGSNDRKIACETLADGGAADNPPENDEYAATEAHQDVHAESFWLSKDAEYDWFDHNAFVARNESTTVDNNSTSTHSNQQINPRSNSISQQLSVNLKPKAFVIGLFKTPKASLVDFKRRNCKPASIRLFPKRSESGGKPAVPVAEPGSPKVSCMGRVRSKRGCRRSNSSGGVEKPAEKMKTGGEKPKMGIYHKIMRMFGLRKGEKKLEKSRSRKMVETVEDEPPFVEPRRRSVSVKFQETPTGDEPVAETPSLGEMKRFASGRRSGAWTADEFNLGEMERRVSFSGGA